MKADSCKIVRGKDLLTARWAGGTTTQLFIYPPEAEYTKFNFLFRMSYATVEVEESTFTFMPGVTRHLMILEGKLEIDHTNHYKKTLNKFDSDTFSGEWPTTAKGKVMDFNLMTRENAMGSIEHLSLKKNETIEINTDKKDYTGIYLLSGKLQLKNAEQANTGDFVLITKSEIPELTVTAIEEAELIVSAVKV